MWQDIVLTCTQIVFVASLLPTIFHPTKKPTLSTSLITATTMIAVIAVYMSLHFWAATVSATILTLEWATIGYQRYRLDRSGTPLVDD